MAGPSADAPRLLVAGGGVGGIEAALALRALLPEAHVEVVTPDERFVDAPSTPLAVLQPEQGLEYDLRAMLEPRGIALRRAAVRSVDPGERRLLAGGEELAYDRLVLALGCTPRSVVPGAVVLTPTGSAAVTRVLDELRDRWARSVAVVVPDGVAWTLAAYELALGIARAMPDAHVTLVTPEIAPLQALGGAVAGIRGLLAGAGVRFAGCLRPRAFRDGELALDPEGAFHVDRVIALPRPQPRPVAGVPANGAGWVPVGPSGAVEGAEDLYAVGDMTDEPLKHGGLAARQAEAAARAIAASLGADVEAEPYAPVVEGVLLDRRAAAASLRADLSAAAGPVLEWRREHHAAGKLAAPRLREALEALGAP